MTHELIPAVANIGGNLVDVYQRETHASEQILNDLGLDSTTPILTNIGTSPIQEYIIFEAKNLYIDQVRTLSLSRINQAVLWKSTIAENGAGDKVQVEIFDGDVRIFYDYFGIAETPTNTPVFPLKPTLTIKVTPKTNMSYLALVFQPVSIINTLVSDEEVST